MSSVILRGASQIARQEECDAIIGRFADRQHVVKSLVRHVRNVHHHRPCGSFRGPLVCRNRSGRCAWTCPSKNPPSPCPPCASASCSARPARKIAQHAEVVVDHVAALDAHQHRNLPVRMDAANSSAVVASARSFGNRAGSSRTASIWSSARFTASGPVTVPEIQIEKKIALRPPSRMRGISIEPSAWRTPRSNFGSSSRCVVSSWVSTTIERKCRSCAFLRNVVLGRHGQ